MTILQSGKATRNLRITKPRSNYLITVTIILYTDRITINHANYDPLAHP